MPPRPRRAADASPSHPRARRPPVPALHHGQPSLPGRHYLPPNPFGAPNLLAQRFTAPAPNRIWLADITYIPTGEGWLYLAAVLDLATRKIVDWSIRDHMRTELPLAALMMAAQRQRPGSDLICHSDRGSQDTAGLISITCRRSAPGRR